MDRHTFAFVPREVVEWAKEEFYKYEGKFTLVEFSRRKGGDKMGSLWRDLAMDLFFDKKAGKERAARELEAKARERQRRADDDREYQKLVNRLAEREQNRAIQDRISREWDAARRRR